MHGIQITGEAQRVALSSGSRCQAHHATEVNTRCFSTHFACAGKVSSARRTSSRQPRMSGSALELIGQAADRLNVSRIVKHLHGKLTTTLLLLNEVLDRIVPALGRR